MNTVIEILAVIGAFAILFSLVSLAAVMIFIIEDYIYSRRRKNRET